MSYDAEKVAVATKSLQDAAAAALAAVVHPGPGMPVVRVVRAVVGPVGLAVAGPVARVDRAGPVVPADQAAARSSCDEKKRLVSAGMSLFLLCARFPISRFELVWLYRSLMRALDSPCFL